MIIIIKCRHIYDRISETGRKEESDGDGVNFVHFSLIWKYLFIFF